MLAARGLEPQLDLGPVTLSRGIVGLVSGAPHAARNFGQALVWLGVGMLIVGIVYHIQFMLGLRRERESMKAAGLIHGESQFPVSLTLITAVLLLLIGIAAIGSMVFDIGPFG